MSSNCFPIRKCQPIVRDEESWTSLVATTVGLNACGHFTVSISGNVVESSRHRLVVQCFELASGDANGVPGRYERPVAATQLAADSGDFQRGVEVVLVADRVLGQHDCLITAWVEPGAPTLDFDGLCAKPRDAVCLGSSIVRSRHADVVLERPAA